MLLLIFRYVVWVSLFATRVSDSGCCCCGWTVVWDGLWLVIWSFSVDSQLLLGLLSVLVVAGVASAAVVFGTVVSVVVDVPVVAVGANGCVSAFWLLCFQSDVRRVLS